MRISTNAVLYITFAVLVSIALFMPDLAYAQASGGLQRGTTAINKFKDWVWIVLPVICLLAGALVGLLYANDVIRKETAYQWGGGVLFAGAIAGGIIELVF